MLSDEEMLEAIPPLEEKSLGGQRGDEMRARQRAAVLRDLRAIRDLTMRELLREIEAIEETRPEMRANSCIPHLVGIDLGAAHQRDRQIAAYVADALAGQLAAEYRKLCTLAADGKLDAEHIVDVLERVCVIGAPAPATEPCPAVDASLVQ